MLDRRGKVPFAFAAVLLLIGTTFTTAYLQQANEALRRGGAGSGPEDRGDLIRSVTEHIRRLAVDEFRNTTTNRSDLSATWALSAAYSGAFIQRTASIYAPRYLGDFQVRFRNGAVSMGPVPYTYTGANPLGRRVDMEAPAGFRILGSAEFTALDTLTPGAKPFNFTVDIDTTVHSPPAFVYEQAARMRYDLSDEGLGVRMMADIVESAAAANSTYDLRDYNTTCRLASEAPHANRIYSFAVKKGLGWGEWIWDNAPGLPKDIKEATCDVWVTYHTERVHDFLEYVIGLEEALLFRNTSNTMVLNGLPAGGSPDKFNPALGFKANHSATVAGALSLDIAGFGDRLTFSPVQTGGDSWRGRFSVASSWSQRPRVEIMERLYSKEDAESNAVVWDILIKGGLRHFNLSEGGTGTAVSLDIPVDFRFRAAATDRKFKSGDYYKPDTGEVNPEVENLDLFIREFGRLYRIPGDVIFQLRKDGGLVPSKDVRKVSLAMDGVPLGRARYEGGRISLSGITPARHRFSFEVVLADGNESGGEIEADVTPGGSVTVDVELDSTPSSALFWSLVLPYIDRVRPERRMSAMLEFLSLLTGFPFPQELSGAALDKPENASKYLLWSRAFGKFLEKRHPPVFSGFQSKTVEKITSGFVSYLQRITTAYLAIGKAYRLFEKMGEESASTLIRIEKGVVVFKVVSAGNEKELVKLTKHDMVSGVSDVLGLLAIIAGGLKLQAKLSTLNTSKPVEVIGVILDTADLFLKIVKWLRSVLDEVKQFLKEIGKKIAEKIGEVGKKIAAAIAEDILGVVMGVYAIYTTVNKVAAEKYNNDWWLAFFVILLGGEGLEKSLELQSQIASLILAIIALIIKVAIAIVGELLVLTALASTIPVIGAIIAIVGLIIMLYFHWDEVTAAATGTVPAKYVGQMTTKITSSLNSTMHLAAGINGGDPDASILEARTRRGAALLFSRASLLTPNATASPEMAHMADYEYDTALAHEQKARAMHYVRFWVAVFWRQVDDFADPWTRFEDTGDPGGDRYGEFTEAGSGKRRMWNGEITTRRKEGTEERLSQWSGGIDGFLFNLDPATASNTSVNYGIIQPDPAVTIPQDSLKAWGNQMSRIGGEMGDWQKHLSAAVDRLAFMTGYPQGGGVNYIPGLLGALRVVVDAKWGKGGLNGVELRLTPADGKPYTAIRGTGEVFKGDGRQSLSLRVNRTEELLFITPQKYRVEYIGTYPEKLDFTVAPRKRVEITAHAYRDWDFGGESARFELKASWMGIRIRNTLNGTANVTVRFVHQDLSGSSVLSAMNYTVAPWGSNSSELPFSGLRMTDFVNITGSAYINGTNGTRLLFENETLQWPLLLIMGEGGTLVIDLYGERDDAYTFMPAEELLLWEEFHTISSPRPYEITFFKAHIQLSAE